MAFRLPMVSTPQARHARGVLGRSNAARGIFCRAVTSTRRSTGQIAAPRPPLARRTSVIAAVASPARDVDVRTDTFADRTVFQWTKQWYPLLPLKLLDESQGEGYASGVPEIQRQSILGRDVVLWKDAEGRWRAVEDRCAHRLAALSLGSVKEDGTLACRYHGWCFNGRGECTHIPQAPDAASQSAACSSSRSKVQAFPTLEAHGLLWIWPDDAPTSWEDAAAKEPAAAARWKPAPNWFFTTDFPVSYTSLMENVFDPSHTIYLHHGQEFVKGNMLTPDNAGPMRNVQQVGRTTAEGGYELRYPPYKEFDEWTETVTKFIPPVLALVQCTYPDGSVTIFHTINVPTKPGRVRLILGSSRDVSKQRQLPGNGFVDFGALARKLTAAIQGVAMAVAFKLLPAYLVVGLMQNNRAIGNQDLVTLHSEGLALVRAGGLAKAKMYLPTPSDSGVSAWSSWLTQFGGGEPTWFGGGSDAEAAQKLSYTDLFDNWELHSKWYPSCRKSLKLLGRADAFLSKAALLLLICGAVFAAIRTVDFRLAITATVAAGVAILSKFQVQQLRQKFLTSIPTTGAPEVSLLWPS